MKKFLAVAALTIFTLFNVQAAFSQTTEELKALREEIKAVKEGQTSIQKDLREIKELLKTKPTAQQQAAPKDIVLNDNEHVKGDKNAKVVLVEYSDYQ